MPDMMDTVVYFNGRTVPLREAQVNILTHALHYGTGVFEGIRGYWSPEAEELFLVRAEDHYARWKTNCRMLGIEPDRSPEELTALTAELVRLNGFRTDIYVRPIAYMSSPRIGVRPDGKYDFAIIAVPFGVYLDSSKGLHAGVVSWRRLEDHALPARGKICGAYVNSVLATTEAHRHGYDEAILLNESGHVAEGATCNLFMVRHGRLITPPPSENILEGITRASVIELARRELHLEVIERPIDRTELYACEELFLTGTAVEIAPVTRVDHIPVGSGEIGPLTAHLRELYSQAVRGRIIDYHTWLHPCYQPLHAAQA
ncbi:MAG: branched-chain amino acid aminotransferase [Bryobacteraceae bacterium]|nr:MAG: branched-chain amino acid aminotransferase [Bryobacteraceae bacterium]